MGYLVFVLFMINSCVNDNTNCTILVAMWPHSCVYVYTIAHTKIIVRRCLIW